jgi:hypothetical protein
MPNSAENIISVVPNTGVSNDNTMPITTSVAASVTNTELETPNISTER